jgi:hypothetical protein
MTDKEKIDFIYKKAEALRSAIGAYMAFRYWQSEGPISDIADAIDWEIHFQKALDEYMEMPEKKP